jgi:DNA modification methylase
MIEILNSKQIPLSKLTANNGQIEGIPKNPRFIKNERYQKLLKSIQDNPEFLGARELIVHEHNGKFVVLCGNMRYRAAKELGFEMIPAKVIPDDFTTEQIKAIIIKDNISFGSDDMEALANEWDVEELTDWGYEFTNFEAENEVTELQAVEDDFKIPNEIKTDIVIGDLFEIGEHRLLCGDSTDSDQVAKLMNGQKADMAHNDPPYGMKKEKDGVLNDNLNYADLLDFNREWIDTQFMYLKENGSWYCWGIDEPLMDIYSEILKPYIAEQKATFRNLITWDKGNGQGQNSENTRSYAIADEKCLFVMMGVQGFNNNQDNYFDKWETIRIYLEQEIKKLNESDGKIATALGYKDGRTVNHWWSKSQWAIPTESNYYALRQYAKSKNIDAFKKEYEEIKKEYEEIKKEYEEIKKEYYSTRAYFNNTHDNFNNVWKFDRHLRQGDEGGHATPKPIPLCERAIKSSCPDDGLVLDVFLGSGSTMVASHQLKRKCYGMELDPKYCQVIIDRMKKLDPTLKIKRNGIDYNN